MSDLRAVIRIKTMAKAAAEVADQPGPEEGHEMAAAYERLRDEARALNRRAGWGSDEDFDARIPPLDATSVGRKRSLASDLTTPSQAYEAAAAGRRARVLLGQLSAWAAGNQEAFELEEQMKANAAARAQPGKPPMGFSSP